MISSVPFIAGPVLARLRLDRKQGTSGDLAAKTRPHRPEFLEGTASFVARVVGNASAQGLGQEQGAGERDLDRARTGVQFKFTTESHRGTRYVQATTRKKVWCQDIGFAGPCPWLRISAEALGQSVHDSSEGSKQVGQDAEGCLPGAGSL